MPEPWQGDVVMAEGGIIQGCAIEPAVEGSLTEWKLNIDGVQADLGRFSEAIYKKVTADAKRQQFQGFRPGTIPPHLEPTYRAFAMDECARETVLEALQQNNVRPFDSCRSEMLLEQFSIPPLKSKQKKKKKKSKKKKGMDGDIVAVEEPVEEEEPEPQWRSFETMKEAVDAGWRPGQSFSFVAVNVKGQKLPTPKDGSDPLNFNN
eukprot:CAMPEP_0172461860 /NCGR_PEP_ID=MMETSP1065-20121228/41948_1 /TAXON_ID=265537 /ORGANISM="Amphiprora paludosa, Strain CCMP125" /LENGTH=205 /DNA_ID=CAMNT_0013217333 /DNA_START=184 /DNA_END=801 /DNA_ORIENTATION=+